MPYNNGRPKAVLTTIDDLVTTSSRHLTNLTRLVHLIAFFMLSRDTLCCLVYHTLVFCFAGNRDVSPLRLFLLAPLILPSEIHLTYCPYISTIVVYLFVVYSCPPLTEGNRGDQLSI